MTTNPRNRNLVRGGASATSAARLQAVPSVPSDVSAALSQFLGAVKERLEVREGERGNPYEKAITKRELGDVLKTVQVQIGLTPDGQIASISGMTDGGVYVTVGVEAFARAVFATAAYQSLEKRLDDMSRFDDFPAEVREALLVDIAAEAAKRGADIRHLETKIQDATRSLAMQVDEVTAGVADAAAGVRQLAFASAEAGKASAGQVTQVRARLDNFGTFGAAVETVMKATADKVTGLLAEYYVKVQAGNKIAGISLSAVQDPTGASTSAFIIMADKFAVVGSSDTITDPANPPVSRIPFGIDTANNTIYINGQVRINTGGTRLQDIRGSFSANGLTYGIRSSVWSDTLANRVIENLKTGGTLTTALAQGSMTSPGLIIGDTVTLGNGNPWLTTLGAYATGTSYAQNDIAIYSGSAYRATQATTGNLPDSSPSWAAIGPATSRGSWTAGAIYSQNDYVVSGGVTYLAKWKHTASSTSFATDTATADAAATRYWSGSAWVAPGVIIDGNLLVRGSVSGSVINGGTISGTKINIGSGRSVAGAAFDVNSAGAVSVDNLFCEQLALFENQSSDAGGGPLTATTRNNFPAVLAQTASGNLGGNAHALVANNTPAGTSGLVGAANGYNFYANGAVGTTDYGTFTGAHDALMLPEQLAAVEPGDIVIDHAVIGKHGLSNSITEVRASTAPCQKGALGVFVDASPTQIDAEDVNMPNGLQSLDEAALAVVKSTYKYVLVNALGEGEINVCGEGGGIEVGDLIVCSSIPGKGMRQADDLVRGCTVAKAREAVSFADAAEIKQISCIYVCG